MSIKVYEYNRCGTCRKALKYLDAKGVEYTAIPIRETPPSLKEFKFMLEQTGELKRLLNTSGQDYRALNMKEKVKELSQDDILKLLTENGNLVKRPFVVGNDFGTTGFKEEDWDKIFK